MVYSAFKLAKAFIIIHKIFNVGVTLLIYNISPLELTYQLSTARTFHLLKIDNLPIVNDTFTYLLYKFIQLLQN